MMLVAAPSASVCSFGGSGGYATTRVILVWQYDAADEKHHAPIFEYHQL